MGVVRPVGVTSPVGVASPVGRERDISGMSPGFVGLVREENVGMGNELAFGVTKGSCRSFWGVPIMFGIGKASEVAPGVRDIMVVSGAC